MRRWFCLKKLFSCCSSRPYRFRLLMLHRKSMKISQYRSSLNPTVTVGNNKWLFSVNQMITFHQWFYLEHLNFSRSPVGSFPNEKLMMKKKWFFQQTWSIVVATDHWIVDNFHRHTNGREFLMHRRDFVFPEEINSVCFFHDNLNETNWSTRTEKRKSFQTISPQKISLFIVLIEFPSERMWFD